MVLVQRSMTGPSAIDMSQTATANPFRSRGVYNFVKSINDILAVTVDGSPATNLREFKNCKELGAANAP